MFFLSMMEAKPSRIIAGCMRWGAWGARFSTPQYDRLIRACLDVGITTFDHADIYGHHTTEAEFGYALQASPGLRNKLELITKCGICLVSNERPQHRLKHYDTRATHIIASVERSLVNLHTDRIDLLLIHRPDPLMDPVEVAEALEQLMRKGKVVSVGVSNFSPSQTELLHRWVGLSVHQMECSLSHPEPFFDGLLDRCRLLGLSIQAWSPLGGLLTEGPDADGRRARIHETVQRIASTHGVLDEQVLIAWLLYHPFGIRPVLGSTRLERLRAAVAAEQVRLERQEWYALLKAAMGQEVP
jgi:predicted oxidoreductase